MRIPTLHGLTASPTPLNPSAPAGCLHPVSVPTFPSNPVLIAAVARYEAALGDPVPTSLMRWGLISKGCLVSGSQEHSGAEPLCSLLPSPLGHSSVMRGSLPRG